MQIVKFLCDNIRSAFEIEDAFVGIICEIRDLGLIQKEIYNKGEYNVIDPDDMLISYSVNLEKEKESFSINMYRQTYKNNEGKHLNTVEIDIESLTKSNLYSIKIEIKNILLSYFKEVYLLRDTQNEDLCADLYKEIHIIENRFRELINKHMLRKFGVNWFRNNIKEEYQKKSSQYVGWYNGKYTDFRDIQSELFNLQTDDLIDMLQKSYINQLDKGTIDLINNLKYKLGDKSALVFSEQYINLQSLWDIEIKEMLPDDFEDSWDEFSKMRNMIAHNKPICSKLEQDIRKMLKDLNVILNKFQNRIDSRITSLEKKEAKHIENDIYDEIFCEEAGIDRLPSREDALDEIFQDEDIQYIYTIIDEYMDAYKNAIDELNCDIEELEDGNYLENYPIENFKTIALQLYEFLDEFGQVDECKIKIIKNLVLDEIKPIIVEDLKTNLNHIRLNYENSIKSSDFDENITIFKYSNIFSEDLELITKGEIYPIPGNNDEIDIKLFLNGTNIAKGIIVRSYGDYEIDYEQKYAMLTFSDELTIEIVDVVSELESHFKDTLDRIESVKNIIESLIY